MWVILAEILILNELIFVKILLQLFTFEEELFLVLLIVDDNLDIRSFFNMFFDSFRHR